MKTLFFTSVAFLGAFSIAAEGGMPGRVGCEMSGAMMKNMPTFSDLDQGTDGMVTSDAILALSF